MADEHPDSATIICAKSECRLAETGRCVEGLELGACPYYGRELDHEEIVAEPAEKRDGDISIRLPGAGTLNLADASRILCQGRARVIAVIGPTDSGCWSA
jgi:hypothetical protein